MTTAERIVELCHQKGVSVAKCERDCGFANGYIRNLKGGVLPYERLKIVSEYFGVSIEYLTGEQKNVHPDGYYLNDETAEIAQAVYDDPDLRILFDAAKDADPENVRLAAEMLRRFKQTNPDG